MWLMIVVVVVVVIPQWLDVFVPVVQELEDFGQRALQPRRPRMDRHLLHLPGDRPSCRFQRRFHLPCPCLPLVVEQCFVFHVAK